ncbi:hypothetical protein [Limnoraphis robusta]|uniref:Uncharacterized protein n=1 Tax=Limnoraphis robusta CS-951 TaxID=1637645 RepID=A0A0F5YFS9_9CYAN|nr:hypothetical protein [Limnoraphis robusta]KKD37731.1 hypothetical protein WN50_12815 [Limnoraphis robusta CS-951]
MKIALLLLIVVILAIILLNAIDKYFLTFRPYQPKSSQFKPEKPWMVSLLKLLFLGLVVPLSYLKLALEIYFSPDRSSSSDQIVYTLEKPASTQPLNQKLS